MSVIDTATHASLCPAFLAWLLAAEKMKLSLDVVRRCANEQPNINKQREHNKRNR